MTANGPTTKRPGGPSTEVLPDVVPGLEHDTAILAYDAIPPELAEAIRTIINRYELRNDESFPPTIAVTSSLRGEGVTIVSQALATLLAQETGRYVCWVDCSWLSPDQQPEEVAGRPGLIDVLADRAKILSALQTAPALPQLFTLRAGPLPESKRNAIARSPQFDSLLDVLTKEFDHVVFDVPPVLSNSNGLTLVRRARGSMFVVRHRATSMTQFRRLAEATRPTQNVGVVLNYYRPSIPTRLRRMFGD